MTFTVRFPNFSPVHQGAVGPLSTNYVSGTGTAGTDNTAQHVLSSVTIPAGTLHEVGDRIRLRVYWRGDTGSPITGTLKVGTVTIAAGTDSGGASLQVNEAWLHYIDATHANIISMTGGAIDLTISAVNVTGFDWANAQTVYMDQNAIANNHIVVYFLAGDVFPKGVSVP